jgi:hypothetical protein
MFQQCKLQSSGFKEEISVHLDDNNNVLGVSYSSPIVALPRPCDPNLVCIRSWLCINLRMYEVNDVDMMCTDQGHRSVSH